MLQIKMLKNPDGASLHFHSSFVYLPAVHHLQFVFEYGLSQTVLFNLIRVFCHRSNHGGSMFFFAPHSHKKQGFRVSEA
jgi:hypothetical protein